MSVGSRSELETAVKQMAHEMGNQIIQHTLEAQDGKYPADQATCPQCGGTADYVRRRAGMVITLQGRGCYTRGAVRWWERASGPVKTRCGPIGRSWNGSANTHVKRLPNGSVVQWMA